MFDDLNQVDWAGLDVDQAPLWIRGLASELKTHRVTSLDRLLDSNLYERPDVACFVVPYVLRILEQQEVNAETELLIELLRALRQYAKEFIRRGIAMESSKKVIVDIDNHKKLYEGLSEIRFARDAALDLVSDIQDG